MLLGADATQGNSLLAYLPFVLIAAGLYFVLIRPQSKRRKEAVAMQSSLGPGDEVQTVGGLYGTVTDVDDDSVTLEAAPGVNLRFARGAIAKINRSIAAETVADDEPADDGNSDARNAVEPMFTRYMAFSDSFSRLISSSSDAANAWNSCPTVIGTASWSSVRPILTIRR